MKKELRMKVFGKYSGRCAYCGCDISIHNFQVDHIWPQKLAHHQTGLSSHRFENLNPSCRKCNHFKHEMKMEEFRKEIQLQVTRLKKYSTQFNRALTYNQIKITESPIIFYFEGGGYDS